MAKKNKKNIDVPAGMSRRQAKLAARAAERAALTVDPRPFHTTGCECDLIAMREFVASASFDITVDGETVRVCTILPGAVSAHRLPAESDGLRMVGIQSPQPSNNPARDLAAAIRWVLDAAPGDVLQHATATADTPNLSTYIPADFTPDITVYDDFNWWVPDTDNLNPQVAQSLNAANDAMMVSRRLTATTGAAWWIDTREKAHVRWVRPENEDDLFTALVHVHAAGHLTLGEGSRYAGMFRAYGVLVPVFDVDRTQPAEYWQDALDTLGTKLDVALATSDPLTASERNSRNLLNSRQITIR